MTGVRIAERQGRDWMVEWAEPDLDPDGEEPGDEDLVEVVRQATRDASRARQTRESATAPSSPTEGWMTGEPTF